MEFGVRIRKPKQEHRDVDDDADDDRGTWSQSGGPSKVTSPARAVESTTSSTKTPRNSTLRPIRRRKCGRWSCGTFHTSAMAR